VYTEMITHTHKNNSFLTIVQHHITSRCENEATDSLVPMINGRGSCIAILTTAIQLSDSQWPLTVLAIAICPLGTVYIICSTVHFHLEPKNTWCGAKLVTCHITCQRVPMPLLLTCKVAITTMIYENIRTEFLS